MPFGRARAAETSVKLELKQQRRKSPENTIEIMILASRWVSLGQRIKFKTTRNLTNIVIFAFVAKLMFSSKTQKAL